MIALLLAGALTVLAEEPATNSAKKEEEKKSTAPKNLTAAAKSDSPLVKAAKSQPTDRAKAKIQIDNNDVKNSKGKLTEFKKVPKSASMTPVIHRNDQKIAQYDRDVEAWKKAVDDTGKKIQALTQEIADLENFAGRYEEEFYNEDDPGFREVLEDKYSQSQSRLEKARAELASAMAEEQRLNNSRPRIQ